MKKCIACLLAVAALAAFTACDKPENETYPVDPGYLYGMDYIAYEGIGNGIDYKKGFELMNNLGVKSIRNWMHVTWFFDGQLKPIASNIKLMKDIIAEAEKYGIQLSA